MFTINFLTKGMFRTQSNICNGYFLQKWLTDFRRWLPLKIHPIVDIRFLNKPLIKIQFWFGVGGKLINTYSFHLFVSHGLVVLILVTMQMVNDFKFFFIIWETKENTLWLILWWKKCF